jgi:hypothetical protein
MSRIPHDNKSHKIARRAAQRAKAYLQTVWQKPDDETAPRARKSRRNLTRVGLLALALAMQTAPALAWPHNSSGAHHSTASHGWSHRR